MSYVYAMPYTPPQPPASPWVGMPSVWTGWDGSEWSLTDRAQGVYLRPGVRGLHMPAYTRHSSTSPAVRGSRHRGVSVLDREAFWPITVFHGDGSVAWRERDTAFWATMDPDKTGTWTITHPGGAQRHLDLRFSESDDTLQTNPWRLGWQQYGITLLADKPLWRGATQTRTWAQAAGSNFYGGGALVGPPFQISSGSTLATAKMSNPGDVPAYPVWTIIGPTTSVTVGLAGQIIQVPFEIPLGKAVQINTDPVEGQVAWYGDWANGTLSNEVDRTNELGSASFASIPNGADRKLSLTMAGTGSVRAELTALYRRGI